MVIRWDRVAALCLQACPVNQQQRPLLRLSSSFRENKGQGISFRGEGDRGKGVEGYGGEGGLGAGPSEALSIPPLTGQWMCLGVSMTTLLHAWDISRQHGQGVLV